MKFNLKESKPIQLVLKLYKTLFQIVIG